MSTASPKGLGQMRNYAKMFDGIVTNRRIEDVDKIKKMFDYTSRQFIEQSQREAELSRAMGDEESYQQEQVRAGTMEVARDMFELCYRYLTGDRGRDIWDD